MLLAKIGNWHYQEIKNSVDRVNGNYCLRSENSMVSQNSIRYALKNSMVSQVLRGRTSAYLDRPIKNAPPNEHLRWEEKFEKWSRRSAGNWGWRVFCSIWGEAHIFVGEGWWDLFYIEIPGGTVCSKNIHLSPSPFQREWNWNGFWNLQRKWEQARQSTVVL